MSRPKQSFEQSVVYDDLRYWGYFKGRQYAADGYAPQSTIASILGSGGSKAAVPGHRILVLDMTPRAWQINARVFSMPTDYIAVLVGRFCLPVKLEGLEAGQPYKGYEVAEYLRIKPAVYWERLRIARERYRSMVFSAPLLEREFATA